MSKSPLLHRCFVCKRKGEERHAHYTGLCPACGDVSWQKRQRTADLRGQVALVTGARVGIGYAVATKLLREGASVMATTRFAHDAARRYAQERDYGQWRDRLRIVRLDLRFTPLVEAFTEYLTRTCPRLDILINSAAQTVRRPVEYYAPLQAFEALPSAALPAPLQPLLADFAPPAHTISPEAALLPTAPPVSESNPSTLPALPSCEALTLTEPPEDVRPVNSWILKAEEVSALELLEVHLINAVAPFLLVSRLKRIMAREEPGSYIVNVSSAEGQFGQTEKSWRHPHTNMAKAALNMLTRTSAKEYARHHIYMNSVDPGWISFQHPHPQQAGMQARGVEPPFDTQDAAARLLDPIYNGLAGKPIWGKFFKDFQEADW